MRGASRNKELIYCLFGKPRILLSSPVIRYGRRMTATPDPLDNLVITFKPEATPEEEDRFLTELAHAILAIARHLVATQDASSDGDGIETIES